MQTPKQDKLKDADTKCSADGWAPDAGFLASHCSPETTSECSEPTKWWLWQMQWGQDEQSSRQEQQAVLDCRFSPDPCRLQ